MHGTSRECEYIDSKFCFGAVSHDVTFKLKRQTLKKKTYSNLVILSYIMYSVKHLMQKIGF